MACVMCPQFLSAWVMDVVLNILGGDFLSNLGWKRFSMGKCMYICREIHIDWKTAVDPGSSVARWCGTPPGS